MITTLNPTRKCFTRTWDAVLITQDAAVVKGLLHAVQGRRRRRAAAVAAAVRPPADRRAGASRAPTMRALIGSAQPQHPHPRSQAVGPGTRRPAARAPRRGHRRQSCSASTRCAGRSPPHGKMMIIDEARAVLGSTALSTLSLDFRREVSVVIDDVSAVQTVESRLSGAERAGRRAATRLPGDRIVTHAMRRFVFGLMLALAFGAGTAGRNPPRSAASCGTIGRRSCSARTSTSTCAPRWRFEWRGFDPDVDEDLFDLNVLRFGLKGELTEHVDFEIERELVERRSTGPTGKTSTSTGTPSMRHRCAAAASRCRSVSSRTSAQRSRLRLSLAHLHAADARRAIAA